mmetsp:Transcript_4771/g.10008  ORF Transcript_4771/g.10008 Transcript_4771/m.10008 type:complete len:201 (+) Transcript_4771:672-1274(+)
MRKNLATSHTSNKFSSDSFWKNLIFFISILSISKSSSVRSCTGLSKTSYIFRLFSSSRFSLVLDLYFPALLPNTSSCSFPCLSSPSCDVTLSRSCRDEARLCRPPSSPKLLILLSTLILLTLDRPLTASFPFVLALPLFELVLCFSSSTPTLCASNLCSIPLCLLNVRTAERAGEPVADALSPTSSRPNFRNFFFCTSLA